MLCLPLLFSPAGYFHCVVADKPERRGVLMESRVWKTNIYRRLVAFFILVGIVPVVVLSLFSFRLTQSAIHAKVGRYSTELMNELCSNAEREMMSLENVCIDISYTSVIQQYFREYNYLSTAQRRTEQRNIRMDISLKVSLMREISDIYAYLPGGERLVLYGEEGYKFYLQDNYEQEFLQQVTDGKGKTVIRSYSGDHQLDNIRRQQDIKKGTDKCLLMGRLVRELESGDVMGIVVMRIDERLLSNRLYNVDVGMGANIVIVDAENRIISSTNPTELPVMELFSERMDNSSRAAVNVHDRVTYHEQEHMLVRGKMDGLGWSMLCLIPYSYLDGETYTIFRNTFLLLVCVGVVIIFGVGIFSRSVSKPLADLVHAMQQVETGNLNAEVVNKSPDEIGQVSRSFNKMLAQLRQLMENVKLKEKQKRKAELAALQAQINPHFLSNTLNMVRCLAHTQKADNIESILVSLIELLHVSMDMRNDFITIEKEVSYVRHYMEIMSYRDYGSFSVVYEIQPGFEHSFIPKLILQPLVENALIHGLQGKNTGGQIHVRVAGDEDDVFITITDNGQGIPPERLPSVLIEQKDQRRVRFSGIGLSNVNERIKMLFGGKYGLYIESIYQMYTTVEVVLPNLKGEKSFDQNPDSGRRGNLPQQHQDDAQLDETRL